MSIKKLLIMCGTGIATSTVVVNKVKDWLNKEGLKDKVKIYQGKIAEEISRFDNYDIIISTTIVPDEYKEKVINGIPLLTGIGVDEMYSKIKKEIEVN